MKISSGKTSMKKDKNVINESFFSRENKTVRIFC